MPVAGRTFPGPVDHFDRAVKQLRGFQSPQRAKMDPRRVRAIQNQLTDIRPFGRNMPLWQLQMLTRLPK